MVDSAFDANSPATSRKIVPNCPTALNARRGHIPVKCSTKQQNGRQQDERCKSADKRCKTHREDWKKAQDQPEFFNKSNKCLNCAGDHRTCDCPTRQQSQAPPASNPANGTGIYQNNSQFQNNSPQRHSQQSASTVGISTPTLMVNN